MMKRKRLTETELAEEARRWDSREATPHGWVDAPEAVVRSGASLSVRLCLPAPTVAILQEFACREGIEFEALIRQWLDERIAVERDRRRQGEPGRE